jgi:nucleoside-diphosphate-sugar epimerase
MTLRVAVTGANGFIGSHVVKALRAEGIDVVAIGRRLPGVPGSGLFDAGIDQLRGCVAFVHAAALAHRVKGPNPSYEEYLAANRDATAEIARLAVASSVPRVVFLSSVGVLGHDSGSGRLGPNSKPAPHDAYSRSKLEAERALAATLDGTGTDWLVLRLPMVIGPGAPGNWQRLVGWVAAGRWVPVPADEGLRSYVSIDSVVAYVRAAFSLPSLSRQTLILADDPPMTASQLAQCIANGLGTRARVLRVPGMLLHLILALLGRRKDARRLVAPLLIDGAPAAALAGLVVRRDLAMIAAAAVRRIPRAADSA